MDRSRNDRRAAAFGGGIAPHGIDAVRHRRAAASRWRRAAAPLRRCALRRLQPELERSIFNCARMGAAGRSFAPRRPAVRVPQGRVAQGRVARPFRKLRPED